MKRIIVPVNSGKLSEDFEQCAHYEIYEVYKEHISKKKVVGLKTSNANKTIEWLIHKNVTDIVSYSINNSLIKLLSNTKINLFVGIPINVPEFIINKYLNGDLKSNTSILNNKKETVINNI